MSKDYPHVFAPQRAEVTAEDEAAGPFLRVEFIHDEPGEGENSHMGFFDSHDDINNFADRLHEMLDAANVGEKINAPTE
jgi:hypothetical protein